MSVDKKAPQLHPLTVYTSVVFWLQKLSWAQACFSLTTIVCDTPANSQANWLATCVKDAVLMRMIVNQPMTM